MKLIIEKAMCEDNHLNKERFSNNLDKLVKNYEKYRDFFINHENRHRHLQKTLDMSFLAIK